MARVFGGFIFGADSVIKSIGLGLSFGVLADAFLVRMTLVPAILALLGDRAWMPAWLDRVLPNIDIEGEALKTNVAATVTAEAQPPGDVH